MKNLTSVLKASAYLFVATIVFLSLISYTPADIPFLTYPPPKIISNFIGIIGAYIGFALFFAFGYAAYFFAFYFFFLGLDKLGLLRFSGLGRSAPVNAISFVLFVIFLSAFVGLFLDSRIDARLGVSSAGLVGWHLVGFLKKYLGTTGSFITLLLLLVVCGLLLFGFFFVDIFPMCKRILGGIIKSPALLFGLFRSRKISTMPAPVFEDSAKRLKKKISKQEEAAEQIQAIPLVKPEIKFYTPKVTVPSAKPKETAQKEPQHALDATSREEVKKKIEAFQNQEKRFDAQTYKLPSHELLKVPPSLDYREVKEDIEALIKNLEDTLSDFGVEAKVVSVQKGPVVTMFELQPQAGVKIHKITALSDDIALAMKSSSVRVVAPIPGRGTVGVEVPNEKKHLVYFRELLEEKTFTGLPSKLTIAIGKDVSGNPVVADLKEMPHLLIAGTTGSGKTVCVNSLISSIIFKARPDEVKFILIDPKMVELAHFSGIPHLLHPLIFEAKKAFSALNWAVEEMERRYHLLAEQGVRNIDAYNKTGKMPYIVIVVDELADLMVVAKENIEIAIQRLAQLSRAVGIHLVLATQRPSVDVITGVIKANFPARISFKVSSKVDSRTVLDMMGAEKLLGKGDLLFLKPGAPKMIRAQGCFVDDEDIEHLAEFTRGQGGPVYEEGILEADKKGTLCVEEDELLEDAIKTILQARQASASILQRRMRVGYTRAARLLDLMEKAGIVGPFIGSKARDILVDPELYVKEKGWV